MILRSASVVAVMLLTAVVACDQSDPIATPCRDIPANGCPLLEDDSECNDPSCAAAYACVDGEWSLERACPGFDAGTPREAGADAGSVDAADAGICRDAGAIVVPSGASLSAGPGCGDLQAPDCPISEVLVCSPGSVDPCVGCEGLFYCLNGEWYPWGVCSDDGGVFATN
jgi:hypothetical protein